MPNMSTIDNSIIYGMFKGDPGTRKSTQALSFPKPIYYFSWDRKMQGLSIPMKKWGIDPKLVDYDDYDGWNKAQVKLEQLQVKCPYKSIVADSITTCADSTLRQARKSKGVGTSSPEKGKVIGGGISVNTIEDYNAESAAIQELVALTKDIHIYHHVNIILIAHVIQSEFKTAEGETHFSRQIMTAGKKVGPKIPAYCTEVYHFDIEPGFKEGAGGKYCLFTEHTGDDFARTALPLDRKIVFEDKPLYDGWIVPAIKRLSEGAA